MPLDSTPLLSKTQAQTSIKNVYTEAFSLSPSAFIQLFEIDIGDLGFDLGAIGQTEYNQKINTIFRFHNNNKLFNTSIFWRGNEYILAPIMGEGFDISSKGTLPIPKLSISVSEEGVSLLSMLKNRINQFGRDLSGAKVIRIKTFAKFLDSNNFLNNIVPLGFAPDPNSELPRDIFYIDRIVAENKNFIQWELGSLLDIENIKLPGRIVSTNSCPWSYRGWGCLYEYNNRRNPDIHGKIGESVLPNVASPVGTINNELISNLLKNVILVDRGKYNSGLVYNMGDTVFIENRGLNYYFVGKKDNITVSPPDNNSWIADVCSKIVKGCMLRWKNALPFGGFPSVSRYQ